MNRFSDKASGGVRNNAWLQSKLGKQCTLAVLFFVLLLFFGACPARPQGHDLLGVRGVLPRLKKTYKLTSTDIQNLTPLVRQQNLEMLTLYFRFSKDPPEYSQRVWIQIIELRHQFDSSQSTGLSIRRRSALLAANRMLEGRMLTILVEDYVEFLAELLELDDWQFDEVSDAFEWDRKQKQSAVNRHSADLPALFRELAALTAHTEWNIRRILTPDQFREFRSILEKGAPVTA